MKSTSKSKANISLEDFVAYLPGHTYIYLPTREPWPGSSVDSQFPFGVALLDDKGKPVVKKDKPKTIKPSRWLDQNRPVQQMTWAPGLPMLIRDRLVGEGGWIDKTNATILNLFRPPQITFGKSSAAKAKPWIDHLHKIYPNDADHITKWLAHRVQKPEEKINHALLLGGAPGIGKDTLLAALKYAVGFWNFADESPTRLLGQFNGFVKSVILRVSEVRDLGEINRYAFYEHSKIYTAAPPEVLKCNEKNLREHSVFNVCAVIFTTNHRDGLYLPPDDRRTYATWSECKAEQFDKTYMQTLWNWYMEQDGFQHVANYLAGVDLAGFDAKAPPPKTPAFWVIVDANRAPEESELADALDKLGNPNVVTLRDVYDAATDHDFVKWLDDRRNRRAIPHRFAAVGYVPVRNPTNKQGFWSFHLVKSIGVAKAERYVLRQVVYAKDSLSPRDQIKAVTELQRRIEQQAKEEEEAHNKLHADPKPRAGSRSR